MRLILRSLSRCTKPIPFPPLTDIFGSSRSYRALRAFVAYLARVVFYSILLDLSDALCILLYCGSSSLLSDRQVSSSRRPEGSSRTNTSHNHRDVCSFTCVREITLQPVHLECLVIQVGALCAKSEDCIIRSFFSFQSINIIGNMTNVRHFSDLKSMLKVSI